MERMVIKKHGFLFVKDASKEYTSPCYGCDNINFCKPKKERVCGTYKALNKLKEYEDLEEQGKLLKFPCAVGDIVYRMNEGARNPVIGMVITEIRHKALRSGKTVVKLMVSDDIMTKTDGCLVYYIEEIGKKIFLTKEQAEAALQKINEEKG